MLAAEHGGLPGGKVGGIGDVIAELPPALVAAGITVNVLLPAYGVYHKLPGSRLAASADVEFAGTLQRVELYELPAEDTFGGATCWVIHHSVFGTPPGQIYHHDSADSPFATDANIYALFCAAAVELLAQDALPSSDVVHLHDWHAATFALLCRNHSGVAKKRLRALKLVFTVHNLALQGVRPLSGHPSSLAAWFPKLALDPLLDAIADPRYSDCYNAMRTGILLSDRVHVVSPSYAREVLEPNGLDVGRHGGEGLEMDLAKRAAEGNLFGILNGCDYGDTAVDRPLSDLRQELLTSVRVQLGQWISENEHLRSSDYLADKALERCGARLAAPAGECFLVTSVGRVTQQKVGLLLAKTNPGENSHAKGTLLDVLLHKLGERGLLILLGSGDHELEQELIEHATRHDNFLFLRGFSDELAELLYRSGDLFLMPSLFEPCGISQLLAMRAGQPCLVNAVGGLRDTVTSSTGFVFSGDSLAEKTASASAEFDSALLARTDEALWNERRALAAASRFSWPAAAEHYLRDLYS